jgi:hypothetical protein
MTNEEHETVINFDYAENAVKVFTTREGVYNGFKRRLGDEALLECTVEEKRQSWSLIIPMKFCRAPALICKVVNPDQKSEMPEGIFNSD